MKISTVENKISTFHHENKSRRYTEMVIYNLFRYLFSVKVFHNHAPLIKETGALNVRTIGRMENFSIDFPKLND